MEEERINLSQRERDRLRVLHELEQGHLRQREAARRLRLSARQIRRLEARLEQEGDRGLVHRLRGRTSNCKIPEDLQQRALRLLRWGRPLALYTDKNSMFLTSRPVQWEEQLQGLPTRTQFGRALSELDVEWIAAHSPQAKGRIERLFGTLQDRLVKEMRVSQITTLEQANRFLEITFWPFWEQRFTVKLASSNNAHRALQSAHRLEEILSVRVARSVACDHTVKWNGQRWGAPREQVCVGLRGARAEIERRLDGSHWLRFRGRYLPLVARPAPRFASPSGLRPAGLAKRRVKAPKEIKPKYHVPADHPWRRPWKRTFLSCEKPDISTLR